MLRLQPTHQFDTNHLGFWSAALSATSSTSEHLAAAVAGMNRCKFRSARQTSFGVSLILPNVPTTVGFG